MTTLLKRNSVKKKEKIVEDLDGQINKYNTIAIVSLNKVRAIQLQQLSQKFRNEVQMKVVKNNLIERAFQRNQKKNIEKMTEYLEGSNILLLTNTNPFKLAMLLKKNKTQMTAKAGDIAPNDIIIPAGNTGLPPGPAISELHDAGLKTKIDVGSVWIVKDTTIIKKGEVIQPKIASVLSKLGFKPFEVGLEAKAAYDHGLIFTLTQLQPNIEEVKQNLEEASKQAFNLALNSTYPTPLTIMFILQKAYINARSLAINSNYLIPEVAAAIISKAHRHMISLALKLSEISKEAIPLELRS